AGRPRVDVHGCPTERPRGYHRFAGLRRARGEPGERGGDAPSGRGIDRRARVAQLPPMLSRAASARATVGADASGPTIACATIERPPIVHRNTDGAVPPKHGEWSGRALAMSTAGGRSVNVNPAGGSVPYVSTHTNSPPDGSSRKGWIGPQ